MGELNCHPLQSYINKYGCSVFVETGTGIGTGLEYAARFPFKKLYTIEYIKELHSKTVNRLCGQYPQIRFLHGSSIEWLPTIIGTEFETESILFWLDAHFPGADFQIGSYDDEYTFNIKYPLKAELEIIHEARANKKDAFIIDDLRIYEHGNYELGNLDNPKIFLGTGIDFIDNLYGETHTIKKDMRQQGFIIMEPK